MDWGSADLTSVAAQFVHDYFLEIAQEIHHDDFQAEQQWLQPRLNTRSAAEYGSDSQWIFLFYFF